MRFDVDAAGQARQVDVAADGNAWQVRIDGRVWRASMVRAGERWSLLVSETLGGPHAPSRSYDVMFEPGAGGAWQVHVDGRVVPAGLRTSAQRLRGHLGRHSAAGAADGRVLAPMPGRVVKVLVAAGDQVEARQGVVVVEAMKMENELRAPRAGTVREVRVAEGASVEAQTVLVVIE
ncbi:MAG TPA: biotin/lipoyl-containing protein [Vicinamibacterales bacterium]|nr:biotin/lipoyl-containing protein [Vicinamibacterales bacterium]